MPVAIQSCRVCGNSNLIPVLDLGEQYLTGTFPRANDGKNITKGSLRLLKCHGTPGCCGLLQLEHNFDLNEMYGANYGYRSGLNYRPAAEWRRSHRSSQGSFRSPPCSTTALWSETPRQQCGGSLDNRWQRSQPPRPRPRGRQQRDRGLQTDLQHARPSLPAAPIPPAL